VRFEEDLTEVATAEVLKISPSTVKSQTRVALQRLRELAPGIVLRSYVPDSPGVNSGNSGSTTCWPHAKSWLTERIAGQVAYLHGQSEYCGFTEAVTFVDGRAYVFSGFAGVLPGVFDMARLRELMGSVTFLPDSTG